MTDRHTVNTITSDALDALPEQLEAAEATESQRQLATARAALASATTRAARAEAALTRLRDAADWTRRNYPGLHSANARFAAALNETPAPAATEATEHHYLSTGCLHDQHDYCSNVDGIAGLKKPAQCKFCTAPCQCPCHTTPKEN